MAYLQFIFNLIVKKGRRRQKADSFVLQHKVTLKAAISGVFAL